MKYRVFLLVFFVLFLSGCRDYSKKLIDDEGWEKEILMAQECGLEGMQCCMDSEPGCSFGLECCSNPNKLSENKCANECTCGKRGNYCCEGENGCAEGDICSNGLCQECGGADMPCCGNQGCSDDLVCYNNSCKECGYNNNPCCKNEVACYNQDKNDNTRNECRGEICIGCGYAGGRSCLGKPTCNVGNLSNNSTCYKCGDYNQPCCKDIESNEMQCEDDYKCDLGFCS